MYFHVCAFNSWKVTLEPANTVKEGQRGLLCECYPLKNSWFFSLKLTSFYKAIAPSFLPPQHPDPLIRGNHQG